MDTIRELFAKPIDRRIEEVIKVDQADEQTVLEELQEYVLTRSIGDHFNQVLQAIAAAPADPHEGIGVWVSGFFGSGKSSFAKITGYTVSNRRVCGKSAAEILKEKAQRELPPEQWTTLCACIDLIIAKIPTDAIIFDVSMDRGVRTAGERITEIMYKALLRELDYAEDFDLAELEIGLEGDGRLEKFMQEFEAMHGRPWRVRRKLGMAINEASAVLHKLQPEVYNEPDSWAKSLGEGRADITPNLLARRAFELAARRRKDHALIFVIDEVGQYVSRSVDKMLDLQAVVQAFGVEGKNRVARRQAVAPCWIVVTSQEKLNEVVDALDSRKIELARLQDRFPITIDLKQSDISEITSKRVLAKNADGQKVLRQLYQQHEGRLKQLCRLERTSRNVDLTEEAFVSLYPYLPYQIDLCIDIVSGLRLRRGAQRHIGGSNRTMIKQAQQMLVHPRTRLADAPIGSLVTLDRVYELLYAGNLLPSEVVREVDEVPTKLPGDPMAHKVAKAISLLEVVADLPRTPHNLAVVLHSRVDAEPLLVEVERALKKLEEAQVVRESEEGYKLLTIQEKNWDTTRRGLEPRPADRNRIVREMVSEVFGEPAVKNYRYQNRKTFSFLLKIDGDVIDPGGQIPLDLLVADDPADLGDLCEQAGKRSNERREEIFWVFALTDDVHRLVEEVYRSREMITMHERLAAQGKLSTEESACLAEEKVRRDRAHRQLRTKLTEAVASGAGFFRGVRKDASSLGQSLGEVFAALRDYAIPFLYPKFEIGNRLVRGNEADVFLTAANLNGLPAVFYEGDNGLNLVLKQGNRAVPNLNAEICREVLDYLKREHSYGNKVTGKTLDAHFGGIGYAWDRDVLRLVLAVLLRGGAIEVTHQGRKYRSHSEPACRQVFTNNNAFKAASFAPRESIDLKRLTDAARHYEEITGKEVDIEENAIAEAFKAVAAEDRQQLLPVLERMNAHQLPGTELLEEFRQTLEGILQMASDDCVKTLAGEGKTYREARQRVYRLREALTDENLALLRFANDVLRIQVPVLHQYAPNDEINQAAEQLRQMVQSDTFFEQFGQIRQLAHSIADKHRQLYGPAHRRRHEAYVAAVDEIKGLPEWAHVTEDPRVSDEQRDAVLEPLLARLCSKMLDPEDDGLDLPPNASHCRHCRATLAQMESEIAAVDSLKADALRRLQQLAAPEKKIITVRVSRLAGGVIESPEDVQQLIEQLREHLLKLLAEEVRIVLE
ncbi:MAG: hypothetical protein KatS3mg109_1994 [Pirellulaceae bacterium]|nr:MAG: hypothetical protein KatS3mg109_1994 [Pirellulaceae bacterium]